MPLHDWTRVPSGLYHHFHQVWTVQIAMRLNTGLPPGLSALVEQRVPALEPDVLTVETDFSIESDELGNGNGGVATQAPPKTSVVSRDDREHYAERANRIVVRHHLGRVVAAIEIVSPENEDGEYSFRRFVEKSIEFVGNGVHLLVVDPFPPSSRDPYGVHKALWDGFKDEPFDFPAGKDRILASYEAGPERVAYVEPIAVGDELPDMPLFLAPGVHVPVPLEPTYAASWEATPRALREAVERPGES